MNQRPSILLLMLVAFPLATTAVGQQTNRKTSKIRKPRIEDTIKANVYADNTFELYINGGLTAVDSIKFIPHNVISVDVLPKYPMTIAVLARDNADPNTGMEYANTNIGDGGFILKFGDGTVTNRQWKAKSFSHGPLGRDTTNPKVKNEPIPENWFAIDFDDSRWKNAKEFSRDEVGPKEPFFQHDFGIAKFIWADDLALDNTVIFRYRVERSPDGKERLDFSNIHNVIPEKAGRNRRRNGNSQKRKGK